MARANNIKFVRLKEFGSGKNRVVGVGLRLDVKSVYVGSDEFVMHVMSALWLEGGKKCWREWSV
jgi:hypothetical protein